MVPNFLSAEGAPDDSLGCSEAEPQEMPKIDQALKAADDSSGVSISSVDSSAPSELDRMLCPFPGVPLRYTPGFYAARLRRLRAHILGRHQNRVTDQGNHP